MNAPVRIAEQAPYHRFTEAEAARIGAAGILPPDRTVELIDGRFIDRFTRRPFRFALDDVWRMIQAEGLDPDARVELIDGELIDMASQNAPHMEAKRFLWKLLNSHVGDDIAIQVEGTLTLAPGVSPSPDIFLHATEKRVDRLTGEDVLLLIEVADSSLLRDLNMKAALYARHGVADYWVIDAYGRRIFVHRQPSPEGYARIIELDRSGEVAPLAFPDLIIRVADLPAVD